MGYISFCIILVGLIVLIVVLLYSCVRVSYRNGYWKGRASGWKECEDMVIERIKEDPKYNDSTWIDLLQ